MSLVLWDAARALGGDSPREQDEWVQERLLQLLRGKCVDVAAGMRCSATLRDLPQKDRAPVDDCADYLLNYQDYLRYHEYLAAGLPIATGVIKGVVVTSSRIGWASPALAGDWRAPRPITCRC